MERVHIVAWWWVPGGFVTRNREIAGPDTVKGLRLRGGDPLSTSCEERRRDDRGYDLE